MSQIATDEPFPAGWRRAFIVLWLGCFITGMAAGAAAAMAKDSSPREISVPRLQKKLKEMGAYLPHTEL